jgi:hypothetical protein
MLERELGRAADVTFEAANASVTRIHRMAALVTAALGRAAREVSELVWDYQDLAGDLRRPEAKVSPGARRARLRLLVTKPPA